MGTLEGFMFGLLGGALAELAGLRRFLHTSKRPKYLKSWFYWIVTLLTILAGGGIVFVYLRAGVSLNSLTAVHVGASAPVIIRNFMANPPSDPGSSDKQEDEE